MREKRVNSVVLISSVVVAACASLSYCYVSAADNPHFVDKYVAIISRAIVPFLLSGQVSTAAAATVWIPSEEAIDNEGSVKDEFAEVAHVFARPEVKVVKAKDEDEIIQQSVPWTSLKNEWKIYQKIQGSKRKKMAGDVVGKKKGNKVQSVQNDGDDDDGSSEEDGGDEEDEEEEEEDEPEGRAVPASLPAGPQAPANKKGVESHQHRSGPPPMPPPGSSMARGKLDNLPLAFYGQENHDDDEKDYLKNEAKVFSKKKRGKKDNKDKDDDAEDDDGSASNEAASVEDYADYAVDEDDDGEEDEEEKGQDEKEDKNNKSVEEGFEQIPLAIREMILNDLANQNNGTGYHPSLTPKVTGGTEKQKGKPSASTENDENSAEENSSEEDEEDDVPSPVAAQLADSEPTPPAVVPPTESKKGDSGEDEEVNDDGHGKGKGKGKKKKGKKGKKGGWGKPQGWGWKPPVHHNPGWGWKDQHDGVLEQLVKGSTWERVLKYYHWKRDQSVNDGGVYGEHGHEDPHHDKHHHEHPGLEFSGIHGGWDPEHYQPHDGRIKKVVKKAFTGSFWERAFRTYVKYKENQAKNPKKPTYVDLDADGWNFSR